MSDSRRSLLKCETRLDVVLLSSSIVIWSRGYEADTIGSGCNMYVGVLGLCLKHCIGIQKLLYGFVFSLRLDRTHFETEPYLVPRGLIQFVPSQLSKGHHRLVSTFGSLSVAPTSHIEARLICSSSQFWCREHGYIAYITDKELLKFRSRPALWSFQPRTITRKP